VQGNLHARFLGEDGAAMRRPHPTCGRDINAAVRRESLRKLDLASTFKTGTTSIHTVKSA
jgi:hypothetical protein